MAPRNSTRRKPATHRTATLYTRSVLCSMCQVSEHQFTIWEREELISPVESAARRAGLQPLYDETAFDRIRLIRTLAEDLEVNLPGIGVILHLLDQMAR